MTDEHGKIYTSCFLSFNEVYPLLPDADWISVTRTSGFLRGSGESAELRRKHIRWIRKLSPDRKLRLRYMKSDNTSGWTEFIEQYLEDICVGEARELQMELGRAVAAGRTIVLMCYEKAGEKCHRYHLCREIAKIARRIVQEATGSMPLNGAITGGELCPSPKPKKVKKK